jgi:hypothetical protein
MHMYRHDNSLSFVIVLGSIQMIRRDFFYTLFIALEFWTIFRGLEKNLNTILFSHLLTLY